MEEYIRRTKRKQDKNPAVPVIKPRPAEMAAVHAK